MDRIVSYFLFEINSEEAVSSYGDRVTFLKSCRQFHESSPFCRHFYGFEKFNPKSSGLKIALFVTNKRAIFSPKKVACEFILSPFWRQIASSGHPVWRSSQAKNSLICNNVSNFLGSFFFGVCISLSASLLLEIESLCFASTNLDCDWLHKMIKNNVFT